MAKSKIDLKPTKGVRHFVFHACLVEQHGKSLTLKVPAQSLRWRGARVDAKGHSTWTDPAPLAAKEIAIACWGRALTRQDGKPYPKARPLENSVEIVFQGATSFGRILQGETAKLLVQANVKGISGLPRGTSWNGFESIELTGIPVEPQPLASKGPVLAEVSGNGPHQPYP